MRWRPPPRCAAAGAARHRAAPRPGAAPARRVRRGDARHGRRRGPGRRLRRRVPGAARDGGARPRPPRLLRRGPGRRPVLPARRRSTGCAPSAPTRPATGRAADDAAARRGGSGQPVWRRAAPGRAGRTTIAVRWPAPPARTWCWSTASRCSTSNAAASRCRRCRRSRPRRLPRVALGALRQLLADGRYRALQIERVDGVAVADSVHRARARRRRLPALLSRLAAAHLTRTDPCLKATPSPGSPACLRPLLVGELITAARGRPGGAQLERVVGGPCRVGRGARQAPADRLRQRPDAAQHLGLHGSWHHYRTGERWRRPTDRAAAVLETADRVVVCFDAPTVELLDSRAVAIHPVLRRLGSDLTDADFDIAAALAALRAPERANQSIGEALLDQTRGRRAGQRLPQRAAVHRARQPVRAGRRTDRRPTARDAGARRTTVRANSAGGARVTTPAGMPTPVCLRSHRPAVPPLWDAHSQCRHARWGGGQPAPRLLVPALPALSTAKAAGPRPGIRRTVAVPRAATTKTAAAATDASRATVRVPTGS